MPSYPSNPNRYPGTRNSYPVSPKAYPGASQGSYPSGATSFDIGAITAGSANSSWYRGNGAGVFLAWNTIDPVPVTYRKHAAHSEIWFQTNASFGGTFSVSCVPSNSNIDASALGIWVDGVYNQAVQFDVSAPALDKTQSRVVNVGVSGAHVIRIQEGERDPGVPITRVVIDGAPIPTPTIVRSYMGFGDSVHMGAWAIPRSLGWAQRMKNGGSRFDSVSNLGQSGYSLSAATAGGGGVAQCAIDLVPANAAYRGTTENVIALCLGLNDWFTSASSTTAATFQSSLLAVVDACKARADSFSMPGFKIMLHGVTRHIAGEFTANDKGSTLADFSAAAQAVATARPAFTQYLYLFNTITDADLFDNVHPNITGFTKLYNAIVAAT